MAQIFFPNSENGEVCLTTVNVIILLPISKRECGYLVVEWRTWNQEFRRTDISEKLLTGMFNLNTNKQRIDNVIVYEPQRKKNRSWGFPARSDINRLVQSQKMARSLKLWI